MMMVITPTSLIRFRQSFRSFISSSKENAREERNVNRYDQNHTDEERGKAEGVGEPHRAFGRRFDDALLQDSPTDHPIIFVRTLRTEALQRQPAGEHDRIER